MQPLKVEYQDNLEAGPGYGKLIFSQALLPDGPWQIAIQRASDKKYLSGRANNPWVGEALFLKPEGSFTPDGNLELLLLPDEVNQLNQMEQYRVHLKSESGQPLRGALHIDSITYTPDGNLGNTPTAPDAKEPEKPRQPVPKPEPMPEAIPEPEKQPEPAPEQLNMPPGPEKKDRRAFWRIALVALLAVLCLAWYLFDPRKNGEPEAPPISQAPVAKEPAPAPQAPPAAPKPEPVKSAEAQVGEFFKGGRLTPGAAVALAAKLPKTTPNEQDAVYRLYYFAAENDEPGAMLEYAICLDPSLPKWGTIEKDAPAAWEAYKKAPDQENAAKAMTKMRDWLQDEAQAGNARAKTWLEDISH